MSSQGNKEILDARRNILIEALKETNLGMARASFEANLSNGRNNAYLGKLEGTGEHYYFHL